MAASPVDFDAVAYAATFRSLARLSLRLCCAGPFLDLLVGGRKEEGHSRSRLESVTSAFPAFASIVSLTCLPSFQRFLNLNRKLSSSLAIVADYF